MQLDPHCLSSQECFLTSMLDLLLRRVAAQVVSFVASNSQKTPPKSMRCCVGAPNGER